MTIDEAIKHAEEVAESQEYEGKKLEESGKKYHDEYENYCASQCFECAEEHRQLAEWLKELKQLKEQTRWIPVSERLPEEEETVIASTEYRVYPETRYTKGYGWEWAYEAGADYWESLEGVMAWMPLPAPYKAESEEKE